MKTSFLIELIQKLGIYESEGHDLNLNQFAVWLNQNTQKSEVQAAPEFDFGQHLSRHVGSLYAFAKHYLKPILAQTEFNSIDEFAYVGSLLEQPNQTKSELIKRNLTEYTTGIEVIKRLIGKQFISEIRNESDKRSVKLNVTDIGRQTYFQAIPKLQIAANLIPGNLSLNEQQTLFILLNKLVHHHEQELTNNLNFISKTIQV